MQKKYNLFFFVKVKMTYIFFFLDIPSSYAKILGETNLSVCILSKIVSKYLTGKLSG